MAREEHPLPLIGCEGRPGSLGAAHAGEQGFRGSQATAFVGDLPIEFCGLFVVLCLSLAKELDRIRGGVRHPPVEKQLFFHHRPLNSQTPQLRPLLVQLVDCILVSVNGVLATGTEGQDDQKH